MGAGNPLIQCKDKEHYQPRTFFVDLIEFFKVKEVNNYFDLTEKVDLDKYCSYDFGRVLNLFLEKLNEKFENDYNIKNKILYDYFNIDTTLICEEYSATFRGSGIVFIEADNFYIVTTDDSENHHMSIGIVPKFTVDSVDEDLQQSLLQEDNKVDISIIDTQETYEIAIRLFKLKCKFIVKPYEEFLTEALLDVCENKRISERSSAWTSSTVKRQV